MNYKGLIILFILQAVSYRGVSQFKYTEEIDSLLNVFYDDGANNEDRYSSVRKAIRGRYLMSDPDSSLILSKMYNELTIEKRDKIPEASSYYFMGFSYFIGGHYKEENNDSLAFSLVKKSLEMHGELQNPKGEAEAYHGLGLMFSIRNMSADIEEFADSSLVYLLKSASISMQLNDSANISKTYNQLTRNYINHNPDNNKALKASNTGLRFIKKDGSENATKIQLEVLKGNVLFELGLTDESADAFFEAYKVALKEGNSFYIAHAMSKLESIFYQSGNYEKSIEFLNQALLEVEKTGGTVMKESIYIRLVSAHLALNNLEKAEECFLKSCPDYSLENFEFSCGVAMGNIEMQKGNIDQAKAHFLRSIEDCPEDGAPRIYNALGEIAQLKGEFSSAVKSYSTALGLAQKYDVFQEILVSHKGLYEGYSALGKYKEALASHELYLEKKLEYESSKKVAARASFENKISSEKRIQADSLKFASDKAVLFAENKAQKNTIYSVLIGFGIISLLSIFLFRLYSKVSKQKSQISRALDEKDTLLREIHHRVKNNLQVVSSLLRLQSNTTEDASAVGALKESQSRVQSMSLIHQNLYQRDNIAGVQMKVYLEKLCKDLLETYSVSNDRIKLSMDIQNLNLDVDSVVPIGLIINELITNSIKYAFPENRSGSISVRLKEVNNKLELAVEDDGVGIKSMDEMGETNSFGHRLINSFSRKLEAEVSISGDKGTKVEMLICEYQINQIQD